jgi:hypothetical protein
MVAEVADESNLVNKDNTPLCVNFLNRDKLHDNWLTGHPIGAGARLLRHERFTQVTHEGWTRLDAGCDVVVFCG